jgi:hypothetical protein
LKELLRDLLLKGAAAANMSFDDQLNLMER